MTSPMDRSAGSLADRYRLDRQVAIVVLKWFTVLRTQPLSPWGEP
jgi:hypothetical protein